MENTYLNFTEEDMEWFGDHNTFFIIFGFVNTMYKPRYEKDGDWEVYKTFKEDMRKLLPVYQTYVELTGDDFSEPDMHFSADFFAMKPLCERKMKLQKIISKI